MAVCLGNEAEVAAPTSVEEYVAVLPKKSRAALEKLRKRIKAAAPEATETLSNRMPTFKEHGRFLVSYAAFKVCVSEMRPKWLRRPASGALQPFPSERDGHRGTRGGAEALLVGKGNDSLHRRQGSPRQTREEDRQDSARGDCGTQTPVLKPARGVTQAVAGPQSYLARLR